MPDDDDVINITTGDLTFDNVYTTTSMSPSTVTLTMPEDEVFSVQPNFDNLDRDGEIGIDLVQELKRKFENE